MRIGNRIRYLAGMLLVMALAAACGNQEKQDSDAANVLSPPDAEEGISYEGMVDGAAVCPLPTIVPFFMPSKAVASSL